MLSEGVANMEKALGDYNCYISGPGSLTAEDSFIVEQTIDDTAQLLYSMYVD